MLGREDIVRLHMGHFTMPEDSLLPGVRVIVSAFLGWANPTNPAPLSDNGAWRSRRSRWPNSRYSLERDDQSQKTLAITNTATTTAASNIDPTRFRDLLDTLTQLAIF